MDSETLNDYLFADLVTQWAARIARARIGDASWSAADETSVTEADLHAALAQLDMRRHVVQALRDGGGTPPRD